MGWERAKNCFPVPNELLQLNLPAGAVAVYIYLLCHADRRTNRCHPSEATMAKVLHLSRNTVAKHVRLLEEYGLIITERTQVQMKNGIRAFDQNMSCRLFCHIIYLPVYSSYMYLWYYNICQKTSQFYTFFQLFLLGAIDAGSKMSGRGDRNGQSVYGKQRYRGQ